jgi:hypothetical protein
MHQTCLSVPYSFVVVACEMTLKFRLDWSVVAGVCTSGLFGSTGVEPEGLQPPDMPAPIKMAMRTIMLTFLENLTVAPSSDVLLPCVVVNPDAFLSMLPPLFQFRADQDNNTDSR